MRSISRTVSSLPCATSKSFHTSQKFVCSRGSHIYTRVAFNTIFVVDAYLCTVGVDRARSVNLAQFAFQFSKSNAHLPGTNNTVSSFVINDYTPCFVLRQFLYCFCIDWSRLGDAIVLGGL